MTTTHRLGPPCTGDPVPPTVAPPPTNTSVVSGLTAASATSDSTSTAGREYDSRHLSFFGAGLFVRKIAPLAGCEPIASDPLPPSTSVIPPATSFDGFLVAHERKRTTISGSDLTEWQPGNWDAQDYLTHHDQPSGGNETDTNIFEEAVSEQPIMTSAEEDKVGQCPICDGLGPVYTYFRDCEDSDMIYQPKPHSNPTTKKPSSYKSEGEDKVGQFPICDGLGPAYTYYVYCENSSMIYQPKSSSSESEGSDSEAMPPLHGEFIKCTY